MPNPQSLPSLNNYTVWRYSRGKKLSRSNHSCFCHRIFLRLGAMQFGWHHKGSRIASNRLRCKSFLYAVSKLPDRLLDWTPSWSGSTRVVDWFRYCMQYISCSVCSDSFQIRLETSCFESIRGWNINERLWCELTTWVQKCNRAAGTTQRRRWDSRTDPGIN